MLRTLLILPILLVVMLAATPVDAGMDDYLAERDRLKAEIALYETDTILTRDELLDRANAVVQLHVLIVEQTQGRRIGRMNGVDDQQLVPVLDFAGDVESMVPTFGARDVLLIDQPEQIVAGDIITFDGRVRRVVYIRNGEYVTQGDSNGLVFDREPVSPESVTGRVVGIVYGDRTWNQSPWWD